MSDRVLGLIGCGGQVLAELIEGKADILRRLFQRGDQVIDRLIDLVEALHQVVQRLVQPIGLGITEPIAAEQVFDIEDRIAAASGHGVRSMEWRAPDGTLGQRTPA
jgi:hypothetical protein